MKQFKPKMSDTMGGSKDMAPEVHNEWNDAEGKHSSEQIKGAGVSGESNKKLAQGPDGFDPGAGVKSHESSQKKKSHGEGRGSSPFPSITSGRTGHPTGVMKHAGKGEAGSIKGPGGAGRLNKGNGLKKGTGK